MTLALVAEAGVCGDEGNERGVAVLRGVASKDVLVWRARTQQPVHTLKLRRPIGCCEVFGDLGVVLYGTAEGLSVLSIRTGGERHLAGVALFTPLTIDARTKRIYLRIQSDASVFAFGCYDSATDQFAQACVPELPGVRTLLLTPSVSFGGYEPCLAYHPHSGRHLPLPLRADQCVHSDHLFYVVATYVRASRMVTYTAHAVPLNDPKAAHTLLTVTLPARQTWSGW